MEFQACLWGTHVSEVFQAAPKVSTAIQIGGVCQGGVLQYHVPQKHYLPGKILRELVCNFGKLPDTFFA